MIGKDITENWHEDSCLDFTSIRRDVCEINPEEKIKKIELHFKEILHILGMNLNDDSLKDTPKRVAKMYVREIFSGLLPKNLPKSSTFKNLYKYNQMLIEKNISLFSTCEHHFLPIIGKAHVAYISNGEIIGLSKINRIVNYYSRRPQVQERLTMQIVYAMKKILKTQDVACVIDAKHLCVMSRGIRDTNSSTMTIELSGVFKTNLTIQKEFFHCIRIQTH